MQFTTMASVRRVFPEWRFRYARVNIATPDGPWKRGYAIDFASIVSARPPIAPLHWVAIGYSCRLGDHKWAYVTSRGLWDAGFTSRHDAVQFLAAATFPSAAAETIAWERGDFARQREAWRRLLAA
jgi:hypothetical protein